MSEFNLFISNKANSSADFGFEPLFMPDFLFDFQKSLVEWNLRKGRSATFADCGMGKTLMQLVWAQNVAMKTDKPVLILTPLAVSSQTIKEGEVFGIECDRSRDGSIKSRIAVTNYERLHLFNPDDFGGVVCDESSILKGFDGARRAEITRFMRKVAYRLLATATAAPNDYIELGTSSEALGYMGQIDMLGKFFANGENNISQKRHYGEVPKWRFKGHAETPFWRWVTSWARAVRKPSDLGFDDARFVLPKLIENHHMVDVNAPPNGMLFTLPACNLPEQREEAKRSVQERCEMMTQLSLASDEPHLIMCQLNEEGDLLEKLNPHSVQISGRDCDDAKEEKFAAFLSGEARDLITKPKIGAWGLNFQHCRRIGYFPSHSFEQYYQTVRRCWRFGQKKNVTVDVVLTEGLRRVHENLSRKAVQADVMFDRLVEEMNRSISIERKNEYTKEIGVPSWA